MKGMNLYKVGENRRSNSNKMLDAGQLFSDLAVPRKPNPEPRRPVFTG